MMYVVLIYWAITLFEGGRAIWNGDLLQAGAVIGASLLAFAAGSGLRGSLLISNAKIPALAVAVAIFGVSIALMHFLNLTVDLIDGRVWATIGAGVGFFAARKKDALPRRETDPAGRAEADSQAVLETYQEAVVRLGEIMEHDANMAFPASELPLPREEMKNALKAMWLVVDETYLKGAIEAGYSHLAYFRSDLNEPVSLGFATGDGPGKDGESDIEGIKRIQDQLALFKIINAEAMKLAAEFKGFKASQS